MKKANELLDAIGNARSQYVAQAQQYRTGHKKPARKLPGKKLLLIAAIIALAAVLAGCVAYVLGLQGLFIGRYDIDTGWGNIEQRDFISIQGFSDSPNYQANKEWQEFLDSYDTDGQLLKQADREGYIPPADYASYNCYTSEMEEKIAVICKKYGLKPLGEPTLVYSGWEIMLDLNLPSLPGVFSENNVPAGYDLQGGYYYADGSFQFSGTITKMEGEQSYPIDFTYRRVCKTSFDGVYYALDRVEDFDQWEHTAPDGTKVYLALKEDMALLLADTADHFISISSLNQDMTKEQWEAFADLFGFTYTSVEPEEIPQETLSTARPDLGTTFLSYSDYIRSWLKAVTVHPEKITYALYDLNGNGTPELIVRGENTLLEIVTTTDGITSPVLAGTTEMNLCPGGIIENVFSVNGREDRIYYKIVGREAVVEECLMQSENGWYWSPTGGAAAFNWTEISEEAYHAVREKYPSIQDTLEWNPITEYPGADSEIHSRLFENLFLPLAGGEYLKGREQFAEAAQKMGCELSEDEGILYVDDTENPDCFLSVVLTNRYGYEEIYELRHCYVNHGVVIVTFEDREAPKFFTAPDLLTEPKEVGSLEELVAYVYND